MILIIKYLRERRKRMENENFSLNYYLTGYKG